MTLDMTISTALGHFARSSQDGVSPPPATNDGLIHQVLEPAWRKETWSPRPSRDRQLMEELH